MILGRIAVHATVLFGLVFTGSASAVTITEYESNPGAFNALPEHIAAGPEGVLWWTERGGDPGIGRISTSGELLPHIKDSKGPTDIVVAPSGWASWVSTKGFGWRDPGGSVGQEPSESSIFRGGTITLTAAGQIRIGGGGGAGVSVLCRTPDPASDHLEFDFSKYSCSGAKGIGIIEGIAASSIGTLWASSPESDAVFITSAAAPSFDKRVDLPAGSHPVGVAVGPEGNAFVAAWGADAIDRIDPAGGRTRFSLPPGSHPYDIVFGPDGAFWFVEAGTGMIGRMTPAGLLTNEYKVPSGETGQSGITVGPDGNIWFTDTEMSLVGKLVPDPLSPGGGSPVAPAVPVGDKVAPRFTAGPKFSPARFAVAGRKAAKSAARGAPSGSTLKFSLSEAASVTVAIAAKAPGRRSGKNCVAPNKAKPGATKCTRYLAQGKLSLTGKAGANTSSFNGKIKGKALAPGGYQASLTARDAAGNNSAAAAANFTITR